MTETALGLRPSSGAHPPAAVEDGTLVTLVRPPCIVMPGALSTHGPTPPIGLAYVAAALRRAGHAVRLIDAPGEAMSQAEPFPSPVGELERIGLSTEEVVARIPPGTRLVGITNMFFHEWPQVREIAEAVKARDPHVIVVVGGENATATARWIIDSCEAVDCCVLGEGEATMVTLADRVAAGQPYGDVRGLALRSAMTNESVDTGLPVRITKAELRGAPRPAWDLVPLQTYWDHYPFFGVDRGRSMNILGTRGCPYQCSFCSSPQMWTTRYVVRDPEEVVDEIVDYVDAYGVENINFVDLTAATNRKWTLGLCDALERRAPGITWQLPVGTRIEAIDREVLQRIYETGCRNITFAPESGSERLLEIMDKRVKLPHVMEAVQDGHAIGLHTTINILIGHPAETWSDLRRSAVYLVRAAWAGCSDIAVMMFCPYPGSADFDQLVESGRHALDDAAFYVGLSRGSASHRSWNPHMSARQLRLIQLALISAFYVTSMSRRPRRIVDFVRSQFAGSEETYLQQMVRTKRKKVAETPHAHGAPVDSRRR